MTTGDPAEFFRGLATMPTSLTSAELTKLDPIIRQRTFFSARVECEKFLEGVRRFVQECMAESVNESTFLDRVDRWLREHKDILGDKFPNVQERLHNWTPEEIRAYERSVRHIDSLARLRLIYRTQAEMCAGWNQYRVDMQPEQLRTWPGWEFVRRPGAKTFRKDHVEHEGDIRLKTDVDFWLARNSADQGGFELPYPPFGFNSWMWVYPVGRRKCIALGLIAEGDKVELPDDLRKKYGLDEEYAMQVLKQMLDKLCKYPEEQNAPQKPADAPARPEKVPPAVVDQPQEETPDKGTKKPEYKPYNAMDGYTSSKTREEAIKRAHEIAGRVEFSSNFPIEQIDEATASIKIMLGQYGLGKLDRIGSEMKARTGRDRMYNRSYVGGIYGSNSITLPYGGKKNLGASKPYDVKAMQKCVDMYKEIIAKMNAELNRDDFPPLMKKGVQKRRREYLKMVEEYEEKIKFGTGGVNFSPNGTTVDNIMRHEFGHVIQFRAYGGANAPRTESAIKAQKIIADAMKKAMTPDDSGNKDIYLLSTYAKTNDWEFFAESFTARQSGIKIPDYINKMLDDVIQIAQNTEP